MHRFDFFKHRGHCHQGHHHKRERRHGGKPCEKFGKRGHHFNHMLRSLGESHLSNMNPQDPDIQEKMRLFVMEFFNARFMERQAGNRMENPKENEAGEGTSKGGDNQQAAANSTCMWRGRGRRYGWRGCQSCQTAGRNNSEEKTENATETQGKKSEEDTEETPYCKHLHHHHRGYGRRHHGYGHGNCQGRFSGDESNTEDENWPIGGRQHHDHHDRHHHDHHDHHHHDHHDHHHHDHHDHHHHDDHHRHHCERHGYERMGWKRHECDCCTTAVNKNADSGSQEPNQEVGANDMQVDPAPAPEIENLQNEEKGEKEAGEEVQEVAETLRKSSIE